MPYSPSMSVDSDEKVGKVMGEYKRGKLKSSSGGKVKNRKQALAIAMSEARRSHLRKRAGM